VGTFWYHGHLGSQYPDGLYGALVVDDANVQLAAASSTAGAAQLPSLVLDTWVWMVADWYNVSVASMLPWYLSAQSGGDEPAPDALVLNGVRSGEVIHRTRKSVAQRVRFVNAAASSTVNVSVHGMALTLVQVDATTIVPLVVPFLLISPAQRASFVLDWSLLRTPHAQYVVVEVKPLLLGNADPVPALTWEGRIWFEGDDDDVNVGGLYAVRVPQLSGPESEQNMLAAQPFPARVAPPATLQLAVTVSFGRDALGVMRGYMNGKTAMLPPFSHPMLHQLSSNGKNVLPMSANDGIERVVIPRGAVVELLVNNTSSGEHPFHLHGHTVWVVAVSNAPVESGAAHGNNFMRRDVVSVPAVGWARIRWVADNPGVWLFHCHIEWHTHIGLSLAIVEAMDGRTKLAVPSAHAALCDAYNAEANNIA
jgi:iron transport multicopper oxidase